MHCTHELRIPRIVPPERSRGRHARGIHRAALGLSEKVDDVALRHAPVTRLAPGAVVAAESVRRNRANKLAYSPAAHGKQLVQIV